MWKKKPERYSPVSVHITYINIVYLSKSNTATPDLDHIPIKVHLIDRTGELVILLRIDAVVDYSYYGSFAEL